MKVFKETTCSILQKLYFLLRDELSAIGYWRKLKRGNPEKGYASHEKDENLLLRHAFEFFGEVWEKIF